MNEETKEDVTPYQVIESTGPWPFITRRVLKRVDDSRDLWLSRNHRKHLILDHKMIRELKLWRVLWLPGELNWWIAIVFTMGAGLFALGCLLFLLPSLQAWFGFSAAEVNAVFFVGSIPFTLAAYLQLYQAANAPLNETVKKSSPPRRYYFGWRPKEIGWLSCALQFIGTVFFNFNTFDAILPDLNKWQQELEIWLPNILGSILFLSSGYLAFVETCHKHLAWKPADISWWVTLVNLLGCVGFMVAAVFSVVLPGQPSESWITLSLAFTLQGAVCFFTGSLLMLLEIARASKTRAAGK